MTRMAQHSDDMGASGGRRPRSPHGLRDAARKGTSTVETFGDLVYERTGSNMRDGYLVLMYIALWGAFVDAVGREPQSVSELSRAFPAISRRTMQRYSDRFRAVFPEYATPSVLWTTLAPFPHSSEPEVMVTQLGAVPL
jgi:hypothetical protein